MARISSNYLSLFLVRALISGNYAERWVDKNTLERRPFLLFISCQTEAEISINGLQYENNKASGIYIQVSPFVFDNSSSVLITNTHFENNELFSIFVMAIGWSLVQMKNKIQRKLTSNFQSTTISLLLSCSGNQRND